MAKSAAGPAAPQAPPSSKRTGRATALPMLALVLLAGGAVAAPSVAALVLVGLVPALVAWIVERPEQPHLAQCVGLMNLAGVVPVAVHMFGSGRSGGALAMLLADPLLWAGMYGAAAIGWGLYLSIPPALQSLEGRRIDRQLRALAGRQKQLVEEWGPEVDGAAGEQA